MLLFGSFQSIAICILTISILSAKCQYYDADYNANIEAEDDDHSSYNSGDEKPDYSKYYNGGGSAPLLSGASGELKESEQGFVSPLDFSGFFGSSNFGTESKAPLTNPIISIQNPFTQEEGESKGNAGFVDARDFQSGFAGSSLEFSPSNFEGTFKEPKLEQTKVAPKEKETNYAPKKKAYKTKKYKSEVDDLNGNYNSGTYKKPTGKSSYEKSLDYVSPKYDYNPLPTKSNLYNPIVPTLSSYTGVGTINQLAPVKTYVPQYFPVNKHSNAALTAQTTLPSYQNLQNAGSLGLSSLDKLQSTLAPFNPNPTNYYNPTADYSQPKQYAQPTEYKAQQIKSNNKCTKIAKQLSPEDISHGRFRRQADKMNCYLCTDPKSGGTYEQCSYTSDPGNDDSYFRGHAEKYSTKTYSDPEHYRKRRSAANKERNNKRKRNEEKHEEEEQHYSNPFNYQKENSHKLSSKPEEFDESSYYKSPDFGHYEKESENYRFGPEYFTDASTQEKSYSEKQSDELKKNGENCKKIKKESMTCMVCTNPKTGGNYEQCSYTSEPTEKKFSYVKEKKYNSNDPEPEEKTVESTETKPTIQRGKSRFQPRKTDRVHQFSASTKHPKQVEVEDKHDYSIPQFSASTKRSKNADSDDYTIPHHFIDDAKAELKSRYSSRLHGEPTENRRVINKQKKSEDEQEDYVYKLFPEYAEKESKNREVKQKPGFEFHSDLPEYFTAEESKKDVDSVLQEFSKKDRSKCKKIAKDKMTCYICQDEKGVQHEECMFVSESQPKSSHIAYHEVKEFSTDPKKNEESEEETADTKQTSEKVPASSATVVKQKRKAFPKKVTPISLKDVDVEPTEHIKVASIKSPRARIVRRKTNINKDLLGGLAQESKRSEVKIKRSENSKEQKAEAEEVQEPETENGDGAYASELKPVYSEKLGMTLPAYMLDISEGEKIFDEAVGRQR